MKKKFVSYSPAKLVIGFRWYIVFYQVNPKTGTRKRFRQTFLLNRIKDLTLRQAEADRLVALINSQLPFGYPYDVDLPLNYVVKQEPEPEAEPIPLVATLENLLSILISSARKTTKDSYNSLGNRFLQYLYKKDLGKIAVGGFSDLEALAYMDYCVTVRGMGSDAYNSVLTFCRTIFNMMMERKMIEENPFGKIKRKPKQPKKRRKFTDEERRAVAGYFKENDLWMFLAICFQYYCFIRPGELRRLKFEFFDLGQSLIRMPPAITKNKKWNIKTIPAGLRRFLLENGFSDYPANYLVFGIGGKPDPVKPVAKNWHGRKHKEVLIKLLKNGELNNIDGLQWYSWKDSGVTDHLKNIKSEYVVDQADHSDFNITALYREQDLVNLAFFDLDFDL